MSTDNLESKTWGESPMDLLTAHQVARRLQIPVATLGIWRSNHRVKLPFIKIGAHVRYRALDVERFLLENTRFPVDDHR